MSGNVWEWTRSLWQEDGYPYPTDAAERAEREDLQVTEDPPRVLRGGSFVDYARDFRCAFRGGLVTRSAYDLVGFRVALAVLP